LVVYTDQVDGRTDEPVIIGSWTMDKQADGTWKITNNVEQVGKAGADNVIPIINNATGQKLTLKRRINPKRYFDTGYDVVPKT
jgi:hypothetical protein